MRNVTLHLMSVALLILGASAGKGGDELPDLEKVQGCWEIASINIGKERSDPLAAAGDDLRGLLASVKIRGQTVSGPFLFWKATQVHFLLDARKSPREIDLFVIPADPTVKGSVLRGIYSFEKDVLRLCIAHPDRPRPRDFAARANQQGIISLRPRHADPDEAKLRGFWQLDLVAGRPDWLEMVGEGLNFFKILHAENNQFRLPVQDYLQSCYPPRGVGSRKVPRVRLYFRVDSSKSPKEIDFLQLVSDDPVELSDLSRGIYSLEDDSLRLCVGGKLRPEGFVAKEEPGQSEFTLKRLDNDADEVNLQGIWRGVGRRFAGKSVSLGLAFFSETVKHIGISGEVLFPVRDLSPQRDLLHAELHPSPEFKGLRISRLKFDPSKTPKTISFALGSEFVPCRGTYELDGDSLKISFDLGPVGDNQVMCTYERCSAAEPRLWVARDRYKEAPYLGRMAIKGIVDLHPETKSGEEARQFLERIRNWEDDSGRFTVEAEFRGAIGSKVRLRRISDGETIVVSINQLSEADRRWITGRGE